jgi:hypothetical protein
MTEFDEILEIETPEDIKSQIEYKLIHENPLFPDIQENGRTDMFNSVFADIISSALNKHKVLNDEQNIKTAQSPITVGNLALPLYSQKMNTSSQVACIIRRNKDIPYNDGETAYDYYNEMITIRETDIATTGGSNPVQFRPILEDVLIENKDEIKVRFVCLQAGLYTNIPANSIIAIESDYQDYVTIENPNPAFGGRDEESLESVKNNYLNARYMLEKGTRDAIIDTLHEFGLNQGEYYIKEFRAGYGSYTLFVKTDDDELINILQDIMKAPLSAYGVGVLIGKSKPIDLNLNINVLLNNKITYSDEVNTKRLTDMAIREYYKYNGVGRNLVLNGLKWFIQDRLMTHYQVITVDIEVLGLEHKMQNGKILLQADEHLELAHCAINVDEDLLEDDEENLRL